MRILLMLPLVGLLAGCVGGVTDDPCLNARNALFIAEQALTVAENNGADAELLADLRAKVLMAKEIVNQVCPEPLQVEM